MEVREEVLSLVLDLRCDLCLSFLSDRSLACLDDSFFSLRLSGLFSRILEGMARDHWHDAVVCIHASAYSEAGICRPEAASARLAALTGRLRWRAA